MPESMAAVINHGPEDDRLDEVPRPHPRPGWVQAADHQRRVEPDAAVRGVYDDVDREYLALSTDLCERFAVLAQRKSNNVRKEERAT